MGSSTKRFILATKQEVSGHQRKLAWFSFHKADFYFEIGSILEGSHSSYHRDGSIWRTSPVTNDKPRYVEQHFPLNLFHGWVSLGLGMLSKNTLPHAAELKQRDRKHQIQCVDLFPSSTLNMVVDLIGSGHKKLLQTVERRLPEGAESYEFQKANLSIVVTVLGHDHNLLIRPYDGEFKGVTCRHFDRRFTASPKGRQVEFEAYEHPK
jgi:hypothetical protein